MAEKRNRPSDNPPELPPGRNLGVGNSSCGGHADADSDPLSKIVAAGARKERLRERDWAKVSRPAKSKPRYPELRCASAFSFLDGASLPEDLVEEAARLEIPAVALVDANGVYGAPRFYKAAKAAGIRALVGAEVTLIDGRSSTVVGAGVVAGGAGAAYCRGSAFGGRQAPAPPRRGIGRVSHI